MDAVVYVRGAERMVTAARLTDRGLYVRFADEREGVIPLTDLRFSGSPRGVSVPNPHVIHVLLAEGETEEVPWDFARHWVDEGYRGSSAMAAARGGGLFAVRLRALRGDMGITQRQLAERAGLSRVSVARIETGEQLPRYRTLSALAEALNVPIQRLLAGA